jgi:lactose/L-arabinose transport system substrate-binding protein
MRKKMLLGMLALCTALLLGCGKSNNNGSETASADKTLTVWSWNVAAKALKLTIPSFEKANPGVKIKVVDIGREDLYDKLTVGLASGSGLPDIVTIESDRMPGYVENFPSSIWDMTKNAGDMVKDFDPSKWAQSKFEGNIYSIPWDSGPVAMFYRRDFFEKAGIDPNSIKTWDDLITAGKKIQTANPGVKLMCTAYTTDDGLFRMLMNQLGTFYFNEKGEITINGAKALEAMTLIKKLKDNNLFMNADSWDASVTATKNGQVAVSVTGVWWGGTLKDQAPELSGKWGVVPMPAFTKGGDRAANLGGSTLAIMSKSKYPDLAWRFVKNALGTVENQMLMFKECDLFPSYLPTYKAEGFAVADKYYDGEKVASVFAEIVPQIKLAYYTKDYAEAMQYSKTAITEVLTSNADPKTVLDEAAEAIANATGRKIAKQ